MEVSKPTQRSGRGRRSLPEVLVGSGGLSEGPVEIGRPTRRPVRGLEDHPEIWKTHPEVWEG